MGSVVTPWFDLLSVISLKAYQFLIDYLMLKFDLCVNLCYNKQVFNVRLHLFYVYICVYLQR